MSARFSDVPYTNTLAGLKRKPTYMEVVDYIERDPDRIKYPDRKAQIMRNSFELSQLDGLGLLEMDQQNEIIELNRQKKYLIQEFAKQYDLPYSDVQNYIEELGLYPVQGPVYVPPGINGAGRLPPGQPKAPPKGPPPKGPPPQAKAKGAPKPPPYPQPPPPPPPPRPSPPLVDGPIDTPVPGLQDDPDLVEGPITDLALPQGTFQAVSGLAIAGALSSAVKAQAAGIAAAAANSTVGTGLAITAAGLAGKEGYRRYQEYAKAKGPPQGLVQVDPSDPNMPATSSNTNFMPSVPSNGAPLPLQSGSGSSSSSSSSSSRAPRQASGAVPGIALEDKAYDVKGNEVITSRGIGDILFVSENLIPFIKGKNSKRRSNTAGQIVDTFADGNQAVAMMEAAHEQLDIQAEHYAKREAFRRNIRGNLAQKSHRELKTEDVQRLAATLGLTSGTNTRVMKRVMEGTADAAGMVGEFVAGAMRAGGKIAIPVLSAGVGLAIEGTKEVGGAALKKMLAIGDQEGSESDESPVRIKGHRVIAQPALKDRDRSRPLMLRDISEEEYRRNQRRQNNKGIRGWLFG